MIEITILEKKTYLRCHDIRVNDTQHSVKDTQHKGVICDTHHNDIQHK